MKRRPYGYGPYRGRSRGSAALKIVAAVLALILVLAVAAFFLAERYMVYDDSGRVKIDLPFLRREEPEPSPSEQVPEPTPTVVVTDPVPDRPEVIRVEVLPLDALTDAAEEETLRGEDATAALYDMKADSGALGWVSDEALAIAAKVTRAEPGWNEAVRTAAEGGTYRIARLSCFKDHELSNGDTSLALYTASGYRWLDIDGNRWLNPGDQTVQDYLIALCLELADLGFDEILLDNAGYPTRGQLSYLKQEGQYEPEKLETVITGFYQRLHDAMADSGVVISVLCEEETAALSGRSEEAVRALGWTVVTRDAQGNLIWPDGQTNTEEQNNEIG